jgi:lipopolysaccharide/colanic/teichoic acid biosynthesis glycosyltransferase
MTLIGPRPPLPAEVDDYEPWQRRRLDFVGGLTCLWQIEGRSNIGFEEWVRLDLKYIRNRSWMLDLLILLRTPKAVLSGNGAD